MGAKPAGGFWRNLERQFGFERFANRLRLACFLQLRQHVVTQLQQLLPQRFLLGE